MTAPVFDVVIVGGGIAGSSLGGVLARAGLGVLVVEKEARFRDRIRGEGTWPWGVAEARQAGLADLLDAAGTVEMRAYKRYENGQPVETVWEQPDPDDIPGMGFLHPRFQEAAFAWAEAQGATTIRPAKATKFSRNGRPIAHCRRRRQRDRVHRPADRRRRWQAVDDAALDRWRERRRSGESPHGWRAHLGRRLRSGVGQLLLGPR